MGHIKYNKVEVYNPIDHFATVGSELENILESQNINKNTILDELQWNNFESKKKITKKDFKILSALLNDNEIIIPFLENFQIRYADHEQKSLISYRRSKKYFSKLKGALSLITPDYNSGIDLLDDITDFFGVETEDEILEKSNQTEAMFRKQNNVKVNAINLLTWLRRGEIEFENKNLPSYNQKHLEEWIKNGEWRSNINSTNYFLTLPEIMNSFGVALIYVKFLPNTVYGAVRWFNDTPLIQLSDRNEDLASCWYTLFHEFGHVILHNKVDILEGDLGSSVSGKTKTKTQTYKEEIEANGFASDLLFNGNALRKRIFTERNDDTQYLASYYNVDPLFVQYWQRKARVISPTNKVHIDFSTL